MTACQIVLCPCAGEAEARRIARSLVEAGLAAAVNVLALDSVYRWRGEVHAGPEVLLIIKSRQASYKAVERMILDMHSYEVPGIACIPIVDGFGPYLDWIMSGGES